MRGNKNKGIVKVLGIGLTAAVLSFTLTGVAENAVTGAVSGKSVSDGLRQLTALSVMLAVPVNEFDGRDEDTVSSEPCTEKPDNETKTEKQEQQEQTGSAADDSAGRNEGVAYSGVCCRCCDRTGGSASTPSAVSLNLWDMNGRFWGHRAWMGLTPFPRHRVFPSPCPDSSTHKRRERSADVRLIPSGYFFPPVIRCLAYR